MNNKKLFTLSLFSSFIIYSLCFAMEKKDAPFENIRNEPIEISDEDYNVFKAIQYIKNLFLEELDDIKDSIPQMFYGIYTQYKKNVTNLALDNIYTRYRENIKNHTIGCDRKFLFQEQGLIIRFSNRLILFTSWGELDFTKALYQYVPNKDIIRFLRNFENKLLNYGELTVEESDRSSITYKVYTINEISLPKPQVNRKIEIFQSEKKPIELWQAMEKKYKEENNQTVN
jgi:hypothetical protein